MMVRYLVVAVLALFGGGMVLRLWRGSPSRRGRPSLLWSRACPCCRRRDFERAGDSPHARVDAIVGRCRNCGTWFAISGQDQWEVISGQVADDLHGEEDPEPLLRSGPVAPPPPRRRHLRVRLRTVMLVILIAAIDSFVFARIARNDKQGGHPLGPVEAAVLIVAIVVCSALIWFYPRIIKLLNSRPYVRTWHVIAFVVMMVFILLGIGNFLILLVSPD